MNTKELITLLTSALVYVSIDSLYLYTTGSHFNKVVRSIQGSSITLHMGSTILAYITLVLALYYFILREKRSVLDAMLLGWAIYFVFDFTSKAIFKNWSWTTVLIDGTWGGIIFGLTTYFTYKLRNM